MTGFADLADYAGLSGTEWSWQPLFLDVDLDGFEDLVLSAGISRMCRTRCERKNRRAQRTGELVHQTFPSAWTHPKRGRSNSRGIFHGLLQYPRSMRLSSITKLRRLALRGNDRRMGLDTPGVHHGIASADLDGDGDLDLIVNNSMPLPDLSQRQRCPRASPSGSRSRAEHQESARRLSCVAARPDASPGGGRRRTLFSDAIRWSCSQPARLRRNDVSK